MRRQFPIFQSHIDLAHFFWAQIIGPSDLTIDATCGNGKDSLFLAKLGPKHLYCIDLQQKAIELAKKTLLGFKNLSFHQQCHSHFPEEIKSESVKLIVYNLGYLPGGDKSLTTMAATTLLSLQKGQNLLMPKGVISITCYPGHSEGAFEEKEIISWSQNLAPDRWTVSFHQFLNRKHSPSLILIQKND